MEDFERKIKTMDDGTDTSLASEGIDLFSVDLWPEAQP